MKDKANPNNVHFEYLYQNGFDQHIKYILWRMHFLSKKLLYDQKLYDLMKCYMNILCAYIYVILM